VTAAATAEHVEVVHKQCIGVPGATRGKVGEGEEGWVWRGVGGEMVVGRRCTIPLHGCAMPVESTCQGHQEGLG
jgi:hypothetical protein